MAKKPARKRAARSKRSTLLIGLKLLVAVGFAVGLVAALNWLGSHAAQNVAGNGRYSVSVANIRFDPPPHTDPRLFLTEVRYLAGLPETVQSVDPALPDRLATAFRLHPWVESVIGTTVTADGQIVVGVKYRKPVLAVKWRSDAEREIRAVDAAGILLPIDAPTDSLTMLTNERTIPKPDAGRLWPEPDVRRAAELAVRHPAKSIDRTKSGWSITEPDGKVFTILAP